MIFRIPRCFLRISYTFARLNTITMRILVLTKKFPYPLRDGESIAVSYLCRALKEAGCQLDLLSMNTSKHFFELDQLPADYDFFDHIYTVPVDNRIKAIDAGINLISGASYHLSRYDVKAFHEQLASILKANTYDVVQLETMFLTPYVKTIRKHSKAKIVLRSHNVEHEIWERQTEQLQKSLKRLYVKVQTQRLRKYELGHLNDYDLLMAITQRDLKRFRQKGLQTDAISVPIGLEMSAYNYPALDLKKRSFAYIGSMDWEPNQHGVQWLINEVWPKVIEIYPQAELHIAGRNMPEKFKQNKAKGLHIHGEVADAKDFITKHPFFVVPLFSGSGMRVKILEAMALGRAVISTSIGLEGIEAQPGTDVLLADEADQFAFDMIRLLAEPKLVQQLSAAAAQLVRTQYDNGRIAQSVLAAYRDL